MNALVHTYQSMYITLWVAAVLGDFVNVLNIVLTVKFAASVVIPTVHLVTKGLSDI